MLGDDQRIAVLEKPAGRAPALQALLDVMTGPLIVLGAGLLRLPGSEGGQAASGAPRKERR